GAAREHFTSASEARRKSPPPHLHCDGTESGLHHAYPQGVISSLAQGSVLTLYPAVVRWNALSSSFDHHWGSAGRADIYLPCMDHAFPARTTRSAAGSLSRTFRRHAVGFSGVATRPAGGLSRYRRTGSREGNCHD